MDIKEFEKLLPDYVLGMLPLETAMEMKQFVNINKKAKSLWKEWSTLHEALDDVTSKPSPNMDSGFYEMLNASEDRPISNGTESSFVVPSKPFYLISYAAAAALVLFIGFWVGKKWNNSGDEIVIETSQITAIEAAEKETEAVRTQLVISLADQPSASKRLEALSEVNKLNEATDKVIAALFKMLNTDTNVNVRLAAVTSLSKYVENPKVREGLVMSITQQESPLVQIALAELMVTLQEQKSINSMETLLQKPDINDAVKHKLEESIKQII